MGKVLNKYKEFKKTQHFSERTNPALVEGKTGFNAIYTKSNIYQEQLKHISIPRSGNNPSSQ